MQKFKEAKKGGKGGNVGTHFYASYRVEKGGKAEEEIQGLKAEKLKSGKGFEVVAEPLWLHRRTES